MILTNFSGQPIFLSTCQRPCLFTESKALVRSMKTMILFSAFFLYLPRCEDHVCSALSSSKSHTGSRGWRCLCRRDHWGDWAAQEQESFQPSRVDRCLLELCHQRWRCLHRRITLGATRGGLAYARPIVHMCYTCVQQNRPNANYFRPYYIALALAQTFIFITFYFLSNKWTRANKNSLFRKEKVTLRKPVVRYGFRNTTVICATAEVSCYIWLTVRSLYKLLSYVRNKKSVLNPDELR